MTGNAGDAAAQMQVMIGLRDWPQFGDGAQQTYDTYDRCRQDGALVMMREVPVKYFCGPF